MLKFQIDHFEIYAESVSSKTEKVSKSSSKPQSSVFSNRKNQILYRPGQALGAPGD
jgi:hypothetical protein